MAGSLVQGLSGACGRCRQNWLGCARAPLRRYQLPRCWQRWTVMRAARARGVLLCLTWLCLVLAISGAGRAHLLRSDHLPRLLFRLEALVAATVKERVAAAGPAGA